MDRYIREQLFYRGWLRLLYLPSQEFCMEYGDADEMLIKTKRDKIPKRIIKQKMVKRRKTI